MNNKNITISLNDFEMMCPKCKNPQVIVDTLNTILPEHGINTVESVAGFLAQTSHESAGWKTFTENLNYSAKALRAVFGRHFKDVDSEDYHRMPEKIANRVYRNRMGNGDELSGDGWKYRGRGPIQLTGKNNITGFDKWLNENNIIANLVDNPFLIVEDFEILILSSVYFWTRENLTKVCNTGDIKKCTKIINGGYNGLEERCELFENWMKLLD